MQDLPACPSECADRPDSTRPRTCPQIHVLTSASVIRSYCENSMAVGASALSVETQAVSLSITSTSILETTWNPIW